jgi:hypothetical protein
MTFRLLRPEEVVTHWPLLREWLVLAVDKGRGEMEVDDIRKLVLGGKMFVFSDLERFALTAEFIFYPKRTVLLVGFAGGFPERETAMATLVDFAKSGGAQSMQAFCRDEAMCRYAAWYLGAARAYTVMEHTL